MSRVLVIGDLHCPADHKDYLRFCRAIHKKYRCDKVIFIGDILDSESISAHDKNPDLPSAGQEYKDTLKHVKEWYKAFPDASVCIGNHDDRVQRKMFKNGIPSFYLKSFKELYNTPTWDWVYSTEIDGIFYYHGDGGSSGLPSFHAAKSRLQSVVCGHHHSIAGIQWIKGPKTMYFGMNVGSGVDIDHHTFLYTKPHLKKAILGCGIIINGNPYLEVMKT